MSVAVSLPDNATDDLHLRNLQSVRAAARHALTKPIRASELAVMWWFLIRASQYGTTVVANFADLEKQVGYSPSAVGRAISGLQSHGLLERVTNPLSPYGDSGGRPPAFRLVSPEHFIDVIPPAGDRWDPVCDLRPSYERAGRLLGGMRRSGACGVGVTGAWRVLLAAVGEALTWGRSSFSSSDTGLGLGKGGYRARRALTEAGVVVCNGGGRSETEYVFAASSDVCAVAPPAQSASLKEPALYVCLGNPGEASSADAEVVDMHAADEWPATTDEVADVVAAAYSIPVTRPIREQASRLSKEGVTLEEMHRYLRWKREEYEPKAGFGVGWVTERLTEIVAQHRAVVSHELHDGFRTAPPPPPMTRADAEAAADAAWVALHTETVTEHLNADQLAELYSYVLTHTALSDLVRDALSNVIADYPWDPLDDSVVLAEVAAAHGDRTGIDRAEWVNEFLGGR